MTTSFAAPSLVTALDDPAADYDPSLAHDQLEVVFSSRRGSTQAQIYSATRATTTSQWSVPAPAQGLASAENRRDPDISRDGHTLVLSQDSTGIADIYITTRTSRTAPWSAPVAITEVNTTGDETGPSLSHDQLTLWFHAGAPGTYDIYRSTRNAIGEMWGMRELAADLSSPHDDSDPHLAASGLVVVFSSDRPGGVGSLDLWMATRSSTTESFSTPFPLTELNTIAVDSAPWLSEDQRTIYFLSERSGDRAIYMATR